MKSKFILIIATLAILASSSGCGLLSKKYAKIETIEQNISAAGKKRLSLENVSGSIKIHKSSDSATIRIKAIKETRVKKKYLDTPFTEIEVKVDTASEEINITTEINKQKGEFFKFDFKRGPSVDYEIWIPENIELKIENVNGNLIAKDLNNSLDISIVNGDVDIGKNNEMIKCEITNGTFDAQIDSTKGIDVDIINGRVFLKMPSNLSSHLDLSSVNGRIETDNLDLNDLKKDRNNLKGNIGSNPKNSPTIKISTVNGKIILAGVSDLTI